MMGIFIHKNRKCHNPKTCEHTLLSAKQRPNNKCLQKQKVTWKKHFQAQELNIEQRVALNRRLFKMDYCELKKTHLNGYRLIRPREVCALPLVIAART